jgi:hypothetical protein
MSELKNPSNLSHLFLSRGHMLAGFGRAQISHKSQPVARAIALAGGQFPCACGAARNQHNNSN